MSPRQSSSPQKVFVQPLLNTVTSDRPEVYADYGETAVLHGTLAFSDERYRLVSLEISINTFKDPSGEVTASLLRDISVSKFATAARQVVTLALEQHLEESPEAKEATGRIVPAIPEAEARRRIKAASRRRGSNNTLDDGFYRRIALDLIELVESNVPKPGGILGALAEKESAWLGREVPVETLRTWIRIARERKFLAPGSRGRMTADPGSRLYSEADK